MKYFVAALVLLVGVSALPQNNPYKWHKASPMNIHQMKTRNLYAHAVESTFNPKDTHQKFHKQTPSFYKPSSFQAEDCSLENSRNRVVNGEEANPNQFPWLAAVYCTSGGWFCTGSFISEDWVLTAGHCVVGCGQYKIVAAAHSLSDNDPDKIEIVSDESILHENYNAGSLLNDIGLVKLPEPVPLDSDKIRLSCLPTHADEGNDFTGELTTVTGWGKLSDSDFTAADKVHFAKDRPIIENSLCAQTYGGIITDSHLCIDTKTGSGPEGGIGVCNGDSGGPLNLQTADANKYLQVGVTSFVSSGGCENTYPHGFTRVTSFLTWITDNTGIEIP